ncbi:hypothetical protein [Marinobacter lutaoensis]|jgi:hypothetical protein|uniref:Nickel/cobalt transporter regulator n=1 Tax=Marinobacter lutaoensis TaxID=135739 RepID=A0A1V2DNH8_9GAMM|nr:hypothetical protein [Marinobacter lutaoensis]MBE01748.1 hypothetical protein [Marinobacter sp.]MBI43752.1 hypothetical protein [Oceanospirillales bacterium]NVD35726.1 hypothetical protein [Marinobacter lutaoensis]ONF42204.1 hypothetical protein BTO32_16685 [Marinobacter lutaoensis]|tara:strand:- start:2744 stop:3055 length:312 start_codon:yes stop_codon:yes gene_type:complete
MKALLKPVLCAILLFPTVALAHSGHDAGLPPGLQKKVQRGEPLPPGWQKKLHYRRGDHLDRELLRYGRVIDLDGRRQRVELEDRVYTILRDTREIVDILNGRD